MPDRRDVLAGRWGELVRRARESRELSQVELAHRVGLDSSNISRIESGKQRPSDEMRIMLSRALDVPTAELFPLEPSDGQAA